MHFPKKRRNSTNQQAAETQNAVFNKETKGSRQQSKTHFGTLGEWVWHHLCKVSPSQWAYSCFSLFMLVWSCFVSIILLDFSTYVFRTINKDREWYVVNAAVALAQAQAAKALISAHHARDAMCVAIQSGIIKGSKAYAEIEHVLAPALLGSPFVSNMEMSFSDRADLLVVGHRLAPDGRWLLTMQSSAPGCFLLGVGGCLEATGPPDQWPAWFDEYANLPKQNATGYGSSGDAAAAEAAAGSTASIVEVASGWEDGPVLQPTRKDRKGYATAWLPSYRLRFSCGDSLVVAGRVTMELGGFSGRGEQGCFDDPRLGEDGQIYLVDHRGTVLATHDPMDLLAVDGGRLRFARIWELRGRDWAPELRWAFNNGAIADMQLLQSGSQVALGQLPQPLEHFAVVVVAPSNAPFVDKPLYAMSTVSVAWALVPWSVTFVLALLTFIKQWRRNSELKAMNLRKHVRDSASVNDSRGSGSGSTSWKLRKMFRSQRNSAENS